METATQKKPRPAMVQLALRVDQATAQRLDAAAARLSVPGRPCSRTAVARMVLAATFVGADSELAAEVKRSIG